MKPRKYVRYIILVCILAVIHTSEASDTAADQINQLRALRERAIKDAISHANEDFVTSLNRLKALYADDPKALAIIAHNNEEFAKAPLDAPRAIRKRPKTRTPGDLAHYLIGTRWDYYDGDKFLGEAKKLEFTGPATAILNGKPIEWHALDNPKIWITGNREFTFNSLFDEFDGGWVPNNKDRNTGRLIP